MKSYWNVKNKTSTILALIIYTYYNILYRNNKPVQNLYTSNFKGFIWKFHNSIQNIFKISGQDVHLEFMYAAYITICAQNYCMCCWNEIKYVGEIIQKLFSQTTIGKALEQKIIQNKINTENCHNFCGISIQINYTWI